MSRNNIKRTTFSELGVKWVGLELNNTCNIRCTFCPVSRKELQRPLNERLLPYKLVLKAIDEIAKDGTLEHIVLSTYGEPFLYPKFKEVLRLCKESKIRMRFGTNGTQFSPANIDLIRMYEPEEIVVSIQYFLRANYEKVKGTKIGYDDWLNQIALFLRPMIDRKTRIQLAIAVNYNNSLKNRMLGLRLGDTNLPYPDSAFFDDLDRFIEKFCQERLHIAYDPEKTNRKRKKGTYDNYYKITGNISFELKSFFDFTNFYAFKQTDTVSCFMPYLVINSQGKVLLCCADYTGETAIGNIAEKGLKEILLEKYDIFMNKGNEKAGMEICRKCRGERTYRGLVMRNIFIRREKNSFEDKRVQELRRHIKDYFDGYRILPDEVNWEMIYWDLAFHLAGKWKEKDEQRKRV